MKSAVKFSNPNYSVYSWKKNKKFLIGYVGVMGKQEGIDHLLETARILVHEKHRDDIHFIFVGSGTEFQNLKKLSQTMIQKIKAIYLTMSLTRLYLRLLKMNMLHFRLF